MTKTLARASVAGLACGELADAELRTSVGKALSLLTTLGACGSPSGVSALARQTGVPKSTAFRLLALLEERGLVERVGTHYRIGVKLFELGSSVAHRQPSSLREIALPHLLELWSRTQATIHLAVRDEWDVLYIEKLHGHDPVSTPSRVGGRLPAHCTALGKALLANPSGRQIPPLVENSLQRRTRHTVSSVGMLVGELKEVRDNGFAVDREECRIGLTCVAAPVLDHRGVVIAAVSISGRTWEIDVERYSSVAKRAAQDIGNAIRSARSTLNEAAPY